MKIPWIICDLDGTLADCEHRRHHLLREDYDEFNAGCDLDPVVEPIAKLLEAVKIDVMIAFVSGRDDRYFVTTDQWLLRQLPWLPLYGYELHMRKHGDTRSDPDVKREILHREFRDKGREIWLVLDDRDKVVAMWREEGLTCLQVAPGAF